MEVLAVEEPKQDGKGLRLIRVSFFFLLESGDDRKLGVAERTALSGICIPLSFVFVKFER